MKGPGLRSRIQYGFLIFCTVQFFFVLVLTIFSYHYGEDRALAHAVSSSTTVTEYSSGGDIPSAFRDKITKPPIGTHELSGQDNPVHTGREIHVAVKINKDGNTVWRVLELEEKKSWRDLLINYALFAVMAFLLLFAFGGWIARTLAYRISQPLETLVQSLDQSTGTSRIRTSADYFCADLPAGEMRRVGESLDSAFARIDAAILRERTFARNVSHELRTPLTVIRTALDTPNQQQSLSPSMDRARRASEEMELLTSACLDLARDPQRSETDQQVSVAEIVKLVVRDSLHLLDGKNTELNLRVDGTAIMTPSPGSLARLVIGNAIRNAFIHSAGGQLDIILSETSITITNSVLATKTNADNTPLIAQQASAHGFGIGLSILGQACQRLDWTFTMNIDDTENKATAVVHFTKI